MLENFTFPSAHVQSPAASAPSSGSAPARFLAPPLFQRAAGTEGRPLGQARVRGGGGGFSGASGPGFGSNAERPAGLFSPPATGRGLLPGCRAPAKCVGAPRRPLGDAPPVPGSRAALPARGLALHGLAMESETSRIPVYSCRHRLPTDTQPPVPSKKQHGNKTAKPEFSKTPNFNFSSNIPEDGVFKAKNQSFCRSTKKAEPLSKKTAAIARGPLSRYKLETELKTKNQLLEIAKQQLHSKLTGAQGTIKELKEKNEVLEEEVQKLKKFQDSWMVILESRNIDPVTGNEILETEDMKECQKQTRLLTEKLKEELRIFSQIAAKQKEELQTATAMWKLAENDRNNFLEKQPSFQKEIEEYAATAGQVELLLDT
ncbi:small kinetochore-associated protein [Carettochelys insculpta]|uniref:small kinetochore-associated protein n=1 Tax=Carettochelys insculpta TaxID=44489 RepID=UPI003EC0A0DF